MPNWQVTLTTVYCDCVGDEVTIVVGRDFSARCTGNNHPAGNKRANSHKNNGTASGCAGEHCRIVSDYKEKLSAEERQRSAAAGKPAA